MLQLQRERKADGRPRREQQLFDFAPDALSRQIVERHRPAQRPRFVVEREFEPGRELNRAQGAKAVVGERRRIDDAEHAPLDVAASVERIEVLVRSADPRGSR